MSVQLKEETQPATYTPATSSLPDVKAAQSTAIEIGTPTQVVDNKSHRPQKTFLRPGWTRFEKRKTFSVSSICSLCALATVFGILLGGMIMNWAGMWRELQTVQFDGKPVLFAFATPVIQFFTALIAITGVLITARINAEVAEKNRKSAENIAENKVKFDQQHFRSKELQDQFGDIQNRLASPEPIIRANAALRLAQFAETLKPGVKEGEPHTEVNHPYFVPVVSQLSTALYLEPNPAIRKAIREAFKNLIVFANTDADDQPLLYALIERLADANRTARDNFVRAFAEWTVINKDWQEIEERRSWEDDQNTPGSQDENCEVLQDKVLSFLVSVAPFCYMREATESVLKDSLAWGEQRSLRGVIERESLFIVQRRKYQQKREAQADLAEKSKGDAMLLPSLEVTAQQLIDTRDSLADSLRALKLPSDFPATLENKVAEARQRNNDDENELAEYGRSIHDLFDRFNTNEGWKRTKSLDLTSCFLAGAILKNAIMSGAILNDCFLQGAIMDFVRLEGASMYRVKMGYSYVAGGKFIGADIRCADLRYLDADFANLVAADLSFSNLVGINPNGINLTSAAFYGVYLDRLNERRLPYGTNIKFFSPIFGSYVGTICDDESTNRTDEIRSWLAEAKRDLQLSETNLSA